MSTIAILVGSLRARSINRSLAKAMTCLPAAAGHDFTFVDIGDLPLYNQDHDGDPPAAAVRMKRELRAADAVIFATPEYNRSIPGVLKNAIDHGSRPHGDSAWKHKPAGIVGISPGATGTAMAQQHLRNILAHLDMPTLGQPECFLRSGEGSLSAEGELSERTAAFLDTWLSAFLAFVEARAGGRRQA